MTEVETLQQNNHFDEAKNNVIGDSASLYIGTVVSKEGGSANSSLENMESLLIQEEEDEDPLTERLLMSGSEDEDGENVSPRRRKKRPAKILDSDNEDEEIHEAMENRGPTSVEEDTTEHNGQDYVAYKPKKFSALIDSESESEEEDSSERQVTTLKFPDSERNGNKINGDGGDGPTENRKKSKKSKSKIRQDFDSESDNEKQSSTASLENRTGKNKVSALIDTDSESTTDGEDNQHESQEKEQDDPQPGPKHTKLPQRASAKKAMDEMQAIQSETQRLYRETSVSIPYHKPKRHTLKEFLTRRTLEKPKITQGGSGKKLKMTPEELESYAKHLEERAKEAQEFFKSESEDELMDTVQESANTENQAPESSNVEQTEVEIATVMNVGDIENPPEHDITPKLTVDHLTAVDMSQCIEPESEPIPSISTAALDKQHYLESLDSTAIPAKSLSDLKRRLISEKNLSSTPTLQGDSNMIIDLETGDMLPPKPTGLESLMQRFIKSNAHIKKKPESGLGTLATEKDVAKIKVSVIEEPNKEKEPKPGAAYVKLKENLRLLITKKRKEDFQKKLEETQEEEEEYKKCCGLDDDEEEEEEEEYEKSSRPKTVDKDILIDDEENEIEMADDGEVNEDEEANEGEENELEEAESVTEEKEGTDDNHIDDDAEEEDDEDESSESDEEEEAIEDQSTKKHRVIKGFEDSDDENNEIEAGLNITNTSVLFEEEAQKKPEEVENELLGLCSGQFEESQRSPLISQIPMTQMSGAVDDTELMVLCSGVFNNHNPDQPAENGEKKNFLLSSDEEKEPEEKEQKEADTKKIKKLKKKKKKRAKLGFSDDEYEEDDEPAEDDFQVSYDENEEEVPQTFIDYDSEENEIEVQMSKKERVQKANAFLEKEAELSESEWGSADENEENLDKYDIELGDEDQFDREKIHAELEQIHMRKVLDDDIREVKKIQDMLFESEETDGVGRQRQFRWKNIESGFSLDDPAGGGENEVQIDSEDDEEEMQWRKMRFEREQLLKQKTKEEILAEVSATTLGKNLLATMQPDLKTRLKYTEKVIEEKPFKPRSFLIKQWDPKSFSGSFLNCDKEMLDLMAASVLKSGALNEDDEVQTRVSKTGNFVFAPLTDEEMALKKRKAEEERNAKSGNPAKKRKTIPKPKSLLLDKLL